MSGPALRAGHRVTSLKWRIVVQFAVLLLPMVALLAFQTANAVHRDAELHQRVEAHGKAGALRDSYRAFLDGVTDAVDSGSPAQARAGKLREAAAHARGLFEFDTSQLPTRALATFLDELHGAVSADPGIADLQRRREQVTRARQQIDALYVDTERTLNASIASALEESSRNTRVVIVATLLISCLAAAFVVQMIRGLTEPLEVAVRVARRITKGEAVSAADFKARSDIDNLLGSLWRMSGSLDRYRKNAQRQRHGLEQKIVQLNESQRSLAEAQQLAHLGNWSWEPQRDSAHWSDEMYRILGLEPGSIRPSWHRFLAKIVPAGRDELRAELALLRAGPRRFAIEHRIVHPQTGERIVMHQGASEVDAEGRVVRLFGSIQDITERKEAEDRIRELGRLALFDPLTRLPNRVFFKEHVRNAIERARCAGSTVVVMFIDLDRFKRVNDALGHGVGDELLRQAAERLLECVRGADVVSRESVWADSIDEAVSAERRVVARLGGDEFTVLMADVKQSTDAARVARRMTANIAQPFIIDGNELFVTASIGIAVYPADGDSADHLLRHADAAMYEAKRRGRNNFQFFTGELHAAALAKLETE